MKSLRVGGLQFDTGITRRYGEWGVSIIGLRVQRLIGGYSAHALIGRFGAYVCVTGEMLRDR